MPLYFFLYHGAKKSKMTKNSNQGGPALIPAKSSQSWNRKKKCAHNISNIKVIQPGRSRRQFTLTDAYWLKRSDQQRFKPITTSWLRRWMWLPQQCDIPPAIPGGRPGNNFSKGLGHSCVIWFPSRLNSDPASSAAGYFGPGMNELLCDVQVLDWLIRSVNFSFHKRSQ